MDRAISLALIRYNQTPEISEIIGNIDIDLLRENRVEVLYYTFPLIERILLETFKLIEGSDIEHLEQGIMKTPMAMLQKNDTTQILPTYILDLIEKYYSDYGLRNNLFHVDLEVEKVSIDTFDEVILLLSKLLLILKNKIKENNGIEFIDIEQLI